MLWRKEIKKKPVHKVVMTEGKRNQRHRENLRRIQEAEPSEKRVPKQPGSSESPLSGRIRGRKKWTAPLLNRGQAYGELTIMYKDRLPD